MSLHEFLDFILNGLLQHALGSLAEQSFKVESVFGRSRGLRWDENYAALVHVCVLFWPSWAGFCHP